MSGRHLLQSYRHLDSPVHRIPATVKLLAILFVVLGLAIVPAGSTGWPWSAAALVAAVAATLVARIPFSSFLARLAVAQPFVLGIVVLSLFQGRGLSIAVSLGIKSTACLALVQLLAHTTSFGQLTGALRWIGAPAAFVSTLELLSRYQAVLFEESERMRRARTARTWRRGRWTAWKSLASVIAVSFVRSVTRSERIAAAMRARSWS